MKLEYTIPIWKKLGYSLNVFFREVENLLASKCFPAKRIFMTCPQRKLSLLFYEFRELLVQFIFVWSSCQNQIDIIQKNLIFSSTHLHEVLIISSLVILIKISRCDVNILSFSCISQVFCGCIYKKTFLRLGTNCAIMLAVKSVRT